MKKQNKRIIGYTVLALSVVAFGVSMMPAGAYTCDPSKDNYEECEEAKRNMQNKKNEAQAYAEKANSVSEIIKQLDSEIQYINKLIMENEAKIRALTKKIKETEKKLKDQQTALAEILVDMHFASSAEPILILAGATSISDLAEKAARDEVIKQEIAIASEKVKLAKQELDAQKAEAEETLRQNEESRAALSIKSQEQADLKVAYEQNADDATSAASFWEKKVQQMSMKSNVGSRWNGSNGYPYQNICSQNYAYVGDNVFYPYGGLVCQCTDYVSWRAAYEFGVFNDWYGDAWDYVNAPAKTSDYKGRIYVDSNPAPRTIAIWPISYSLPEIRPYGHVQWVESVDYASGTMNVTEYNVYSPDIGCYEKDFCSRTRSYYGAQFLHFE